MGWHKHHVLVIGGASFIGSHLVDVLLRREVTVRVVDDWRPIMVGGAMSICTRQDPPQRSW
jgi:nucleoside-diphosphate-sugar epimerase